MSEPQPKAPARGKALAALAVGALGVVYGDIGTSPLYALREAFDGQHGVPVTPENVLGILSLIFWSINFLISFKYVMHMMRADNQGEGGILALMALLSAPEHQNRRRMYLLLFGLFGASLLYGDGVITPAISVLGAMEGLAIAAPGLGDWVVWISLVIIVGLFAVQRKGTGLVGALFGPVTTVWFLSIAALGIVSIWQEPAILAALSPTHAAAFFVRNGFTGFLVLSAVVLVVTGGEALYADMGHFGKRPIRVAWFAVVLPSLLLNYFGQGALLLRDPEAVHNAFYNLVPGWALYPMIVIATGAAITASQALISGAFSLTQQAVQLGFCPRVTIVHTSRSEAGQIYVPEVNWLLMLACVGLVLTFRSSTNLAATYGVAITGTMATTSLLFMVVARTRWRWALWKVLSLGGLFLTVDLAFAFANLEKIPSGGWIPLAIAGVVYILMSTWKRGRTLLFDYTRENSMGLQAFIDDVGLNQPPRVPGIAVFMTSDPTVAPSVLLHHLKHNKVLHEKMVLMSVKTENIPTVSSEDRVTFTRFGEGFSQVIARYGFMETPNVPAVLLQLEQLGITKSMMRTTFYLGRETLLPTGKTRFAGWRKRLFILMTRNARSATAFFGLPPNRVVELGAQVQL